MNQVDGIKNTSKSAKDMTKWLIIFRLTLEINRRASKRGGSPSFYLIPPSPPRGRGIKGDGVETNRDCFAWLAMAGG